MDTPHAPNVQTPFLKRIHWTVWCLFGIGAALLVIDHWAHVLGALPYLVLLACPLMHLFMHRGHGSHHKNDDQTHSMH
jgi:hypothetical protein